MCIFLVGNSFAQQDSLKKITVKGFPLIYYTPESRLGVGIIGLVLFRFKKDLSDTRISNVNLGLAYTQNKQFLFYLPYSFFLKNDTYRLNGEIGYYNYTYFYFGIGNGNDISEKEQYRVVYPRLRANVYKRVTKNLFAGIRYAFDDFGQFTYSDTGNLIQREVIGTYGGTNSGIGLGLQYDSRDAQFYPRKGFLGEIHFVRDDSWSGSNYQFSKFTFDITNYLSLAPKSVLASNFNLILSSKNTPYYLLGLLGGGKRLRGVFEGQYRDRIAGQAQVEFRQEFLKNWGFVGFIGTGLIAPTTSSLLIKNVKVAYGVGLRYKLNKKDHVNIRVDVGISDGKLLPYVTLSEAF